MSNWIFSKTRDLIWLFIPVWLCWFVAFVLPSEWLNQKTPLWVWVIFVLGIDVSHVWSTLFRTYVDKEEFRNHRKLLVFGPVVAFLIALAIASVSITVFWRILAYVAVFHFVKQQYGFMRIYKAKAKDFRKKWISDNFMIYFSMLYPIFFWHVNLDRQFSWFFKGDFLQWEVATLVPVLNITGSIIYFMILSAWLIQEILAGKRSTFPMGKILWVLTTAGNWYIGIVYFNSDLVFTVTNVVAHGIPYMALVLFYQQKKFEMRARKIKPLTYSLMVITGVLVLALGEEYFWDIWVNQENEAFFGSFLPYLQKQPAYTWQVIATALLSVPQVTHYIVDGFIWKNNEKNPYLKKAILG